MHMSMNTVHLSTRRKSMEHIWMAEFLRWAISQTRKHHWSRDSEYAFTEGGYFLTKEEANQYIIDRLDEKAKEYEARKTEWQEKAILEKDKGD